MVHSQTRNAEDEGRTGHWNSPILDNSASRESIITRRDFTKLVSNIYFSRYEDIAAFLRPYIDFRAP